ncbi:MAG: peroxiredoxin family protein [Gammaproteobacteria bacterium]|jgi:peroxiredoxin family protein
MSTTSLFILMCSGEHEKIQMAAMAASLAAVSERPVEVFISMNAVKSFQKNPHGNRYSGGEFSKLLLDKNAPDPIDLFQQGKDLGELKLYACSMAMDVAGLELDDFVDDLIDSAAGLTKFLSDAETGQLIVF